MNSSRANKSESSTAVPESPSSPGDLDDSTADNSHFQKWSRLHSDAGLSMTTALSTAVGGVEQCCQENPQSEKKSKKRENEEVKLRQIHSSNKWKAVHFSGLLHC